MSLEMINPPSWGAPKGYSNGMLAPAGGRLLFIAGQIGWDANQQLVSSEFAGQFGQALANVVAVVREAGGGPADIARLTIYVTDKQAYLNDLKGVGAAYREVLGRHFPAMALLEIKGLVEDGALLEIEGTAVLSA